MNPFSFMTDPAIDLMKATTEEFDKILSSGAVGTPITVGDYTIIPLLITTFGVGAGGGSLVGESVGGGGGGGVIPCAVLVIGPDGVDLKMVSPEVTQSAHQSVARIVADATSRYKRTTTTQKVTVSTPVTVAAPSTVETETVPA